MANVRLLDDINAAADARHDQRKLAKKSLSW